MVKAQLSFQLFENLNFLGKVFRVGVIVEIFIGRPSKPVRFSSQLIGEVFIIVGLWTLLDELFCIGGLATKGEIASRVLVSWLHILIIPPIPGKLRRVRGQLRTWSCSLDEILGNWSFQSISSPAPEAFEVGGVHVEVGPLQLIVLFIMVHDIRYQLLLVETALVNGVFGEVGLDHVELAQMPAALALIAHALLIVMVLEVVAQQLGGSLAKAVLLSHAELVVMMTALGLPELAHVEGHAVVSEIEIGCHSALEFGLELQFLGGVRNRSLGKRSHPGSSSSNNFINDNQY